MGQPGPVPWPLQETARRLDDYRWVEARLFEVLGAWAVTTPEPQVKLLLSMHAREHAWHSELWAERLPQARGLPPGEPAVRAPERLKAFFEAFAGPEAPEQTVERLAGVYRLLVPRCVAAYSRHLDATAEVTDAPVIRTLRLVLQDELEEWRAGELLLQSLLATEPLVERVAVHERRLEWLLVEAGGI